MTDRRQVECPICKRKFGVTLDQMAKGSIRCPAGHVGKVKNPKVPQRVAKAKGEMDAAIERLKKIAKGK